MSRPKGKATFRMSRVDIFGHEKTGGMRMGSYALIQFAGAQNILGVIEKSPRALAGQFGEPLSYVQTCIKELTQRKMARWWPELDVLWIVEHLDEQSWNRSMDAAAAKLLRTLHPKVRDAVIARYGDRVTGHGMTDGDEHGVDHGDPDGDPTSEIRDQGSNSLRSSPVAPKGASKKTPVVEPELALGEASVASQVVTASGVDGDLLTPGEIASGVTASVGGPPANDLPGEESPGLLQACSPARKGGRRKPRALVPDGLAEHALATLQAACRELTGNPSAGPRSLTPGMLDSLAKLHASEQPTAEDWTRVIRRRLELSRQGDGYGDLTWEHLCRPASFRRYRDHVASRSAPRGRAEPGPRPTTTGPIDLRTYSREETPT